MECSGCDWDPRKNIELVVVFTERNGTQRIISARKAKRKEEKIYYDSIT
jgi:uncharacterized DUF497 family protein